MVQRPDILTVTPNPSLDLLHEAEHIVWDDANRVDPPRRRPGGQGINVARAVRTLGGSALVVAPLGGRTGEELAADMDAEGLPYVTTVAPGETRIFSAIRENSTGRSLLINPCGPTFGKADVDALMNAVTKAVADSRPGWVACCGSLPPGFPTDFYATLMRAARQYGARCIADCDGEPLRMAAAEGCDLLVPNRYEAERLTGMVVHDVVSAAAAAGALVDRGTPLVAITLGSEGAVIRGQGGLYASHARAHARGAGSAVGAGDAFLAALLLALNAGAGEAVALAEAVAAGTSVLSSSGRDLVDAVAYREIRSSVEVREVR